MPHSKTTNQKMGEGHDIEESFYYIMTFLAQPHGYTILSHKKFYNIFGIIESRDLIQHKYNLLTFSRTL